MSSICVQIVPGTTHMFWLRHSNMLLNMLTAVGLRETMLEHLRDGMPRGAVWGFGIHGMIAKIVQKEDAHYSTTSVST